MPKNKKADNRNRPAPFQPFLVFLARLVYEKRLRPDLLVELVGRDTANYVLDNANNWIGKPALGPTTAVVLHGALHKFTGAIDDVKSRIASHWEKIIQEIEQGEQPTFNPTPQPSPNANKRKNWPPKPKNY